MACQGRGLAVEGELGVDVFHDAFDDEVGVFERVVGRTVVDGIGDFGRDESLGAVERRPAMIPQRDLVTFARKDLGYRVAHRAGARHGDATDGRCGIRVLCGS